MFAVIKTGGKQYKVSSNDVLRVEKLAAEEGATIQFNEVLMVGGDGAPTVGAPRVEGAGVQAEVMAQIKGEKTISFKKRRRKHSSQRRKGHRQELTLFPAGTGRLEPVGVHRRQRVRSTRNLGRHFRDFWKAVRHIGAGRGLFRRHEFRITLAGRS